MNLYNIKEAFHEKCVICEKEKQAGIHLYTSFICTDCEQDLVTLETNDEKYKEILYQLRKITKPMIDIR